MAISYSYFCDQHVAEHTVRTWWPLLKSKMQIQATVVSSPPSRPYPQLVLPSWPIPGPPSAQIRPTSSAAGPSHTTVQGSELPLKGSCAQPAWRVWSPRGLSILSLGLMYVASPAQLLTWGQARRRASCLSSPLLEFSRSLPGPPGHSLLQSTQGGFKIHECLRTHLQLTKLLPLPSWQDPYFSLGIFRNVLK